jgi:hypothetical protein
MSRNNNSLQHFIQTFNSKVALFFRTFHSDGYKPTEVTNSLFSDIVDTCTKIDITSISVNVDDISVTLAFNLNKSEHLRSLDPSSVIYCDIFRNDDPTRKTRFRFSAASIDISNFRQNFDLYRTPTCLRCGIASDDLEHLNRQLFCPKCFDLEPSVCGDCGSEYLGYNYGIADFGVFFCEKCSSE